MFKPITFKCEVLDMVEYPDLDFAYVIERDILGDGKYKAICWHHGREFKQTFDTRADALEYTRYLFLKAKVKTIQTKDSHTGVSILVKYGMRKGEIAEIVNGRYTVSEDGKYTLEDSAVNDLKDYVGKDMPLGYNWMFLVRNIGNIAMYLYDQHIELRQYWRANVYVPYVLIRSIQDESITQIIEYPGRFVNFVEEWIREHVDTLARLEEEYEDMPHWLVGDMIGEEVVRILSMEEMDEL